MAAFIRAVDCVWRAGVGVGAHDLGKTGLDQGRMRHAVKWFRERNLGQARLWGDGWDAWRGRQGW